MKKIILLALTALMVVGCENERPIETVNGANVVTIDSCEYILLNSVGIKAHKGNCHFCKERRQKEMEELVTKLKEK